MKAFVQAGAGVVHAAFRNDDTSWLIPLGAGIEYEVGNPAVNAYAAFILDLTDLDTGRGTETDVMPGVVFGIRF